MPPSEKFVVTAARCPLMREPTRASEQLDELLMGWTLEILGWPAPGWCRARSGYGYEGFAPAAALCVDSSRSAAFAAAEKRVVTRGFCTALSAPNVRSWPVAELTRGALAVPRSEPDEDGWVKVSLPGRQIGYIKDGFLGPYQTRRVLEEADFRRAVADSALSYLGTHYRWGGKTPLGIDCSGLAFMAYWLHGVTICRDARLDPDFPVHEVPRSALRQGDLLYFPGHMAVYLGEGRYVHATARDGSDGVVVNSLDPGDSEYREDLAKNLTAVGSIFSP